MRAKAGEDNSRPHKTETLFDMRDNTAAEMAWACAVYAMVPYLGIIFTPLSFVFGLFGLYRSYNDEQHYGYQRSVQSIIMSIVLFCIHIFLWWLLFAVPKLGRNI